MQKTNKSGAAADGLAQTNALAQSPETLGAYPQIRLRRNRQTDWSRRLVAENQLSVNDLIWPVFVREDDNPEVEITSMPGVKRYSVSEAADAVAAAGELGVPAIALFPYVESHKKTPDAREALDPDNLVCRAVRELKKSAPSVGVICDVALDPFNSDGHDGLVSNGEILNDESLDILCGQALVQAQAGCDVIAPSDMMDGRIGTIRAALDSEGYQNTAIMSYAAKYASAFYGPFRDAIGSGGALKGDKKTYQMDPANGAEALREAAMDLDEGADILMVKPGLPYLDIIHRLKSTLQVPVTAYQVSGEYAMVQAAAERGWIDGEKVMLESLMAFKRAGADAVLTYFAVEVAKRLKAG